MVDWRMKKWFVGSVEVQLTNQSGQLMWNTVIYEIAEICRMLLLDSLKVHRMASIREMLETECSTQAQDIPLGVSAFSQLMDVSVMRTFKKKIK
ncbi:hypothetical protein F444_08059 [Phytophthora nicotianae P1976]|uniref:DDE-1 domain-containing protein n=1 Tax=Phytophthora nicotianae P1976 TaxID=1317066 RepID=A0A081ACG9_PHYNI|nr:hypothetical protein F444_08059 [Phytophthora nicotianae P1976]